MFRLAVVVVVLAISLPALAQQSSPVNPQDSRAQIRAALLAQTPIGSSITRVEDFIRANLLPKDAPMPPVEGYLSGDLAARVQNGAKYIRVELGHYFANSGAIFLTAPMMQQKQVTALWTFDDHDRLLDVHVGKAVKTY